MTKINLWEWLDYPSVESTNDLAKEQSLNFAGKKLVITAVEQTKGRGRRGRSWISSRGNLFLSQLLPAEFSAAELVFISSLSLAQTFSGLKEELDIAIKWPNDVLINGRKISGILIETAENDAVVIGIGVNLKSSPDDKDVLFPAINLESLGVEISRADFLKTYLNRFDNNVELLHRQGFSSIRQAWLKYAWRLGLPIKVRSQSQEFEGIFKGIDEQGILLLQQGKNIVKIAVGDLFC